ncbi:MAG: hypothetical protein AMXMBFR84_38080 [Candidatus Hydrogenedentota bacterium]
MAGRIDDIEVVILPIDSAVLGTDGNAAFLFQLIGVHDPFGYAGIFAKRVGNAENGVDEGGFTMVDVRNNGDIADLICGMHGRI